MYMPFKLNFFRSKRISGSYIKAFSKSQLGDLSLKTLAINPKSHGTFAGFGSYVQANK